VAAFREKLALKTTFNDIENKVLQEVALWAKAFKVDDLQQLQLLQKMIKAKTSRAFAFNQLIKNYEMFST
jgi:hypothetical protein